MPINHKLPGPKDPWDALRGEHADHPLRAVVGSDDVLNHYIDAAQKAFYTRALPLKEDYTVLDFGCGNGRWSLWFAPHVARVFGIDLSPDMVSAALRFASERRVRNVDFTVFDGDAVPFSEDSFDLVNCVWVLKYIISDAEAVRTIMELSRVTRPGGHVAIIERVNWPEDRLMEREGYFQGRAFYRRPDFYIDAFRECDMHLEYHAATNASPLFGTYMRLCRALNERVDISFPTLARCITAVSVWGDLLSGRRERFRNGDHFFLFRKGEEAGEPEEPSSPLKRLPFIRDA